MSKKQITDSLIRSLAKHPYLWTLVLCLLTDPFCFGSMGNIPNNVLLLESFAVLGIAYAFGKKRQRSSEHASTALTVYMLCVVVMIVLAAKMYGKSEHKNLWQFFGGWLAVIALYFTFDTERLKEQKNSLLIILLGFVMKVHYILITSVYTRQHDVYHFDGPSGHAAYIDYFLNNHHMPDFDPRNIWQFVHPPLHHIISAIWIYASENIFMVGHDQARESLQVLTLFYSMCIIISAYKILRFFGLKGKALYIPLMIVSFHPAFILFSGSINNDVLSVALVMGAIVSTLEWQKDPTLKNILKIALCIGLAMMTKIAAATIAPPVAVVFLMVFMKNFKQKGEVLFGQFCAFGIVCIPLGLWFGIRNYIKWELPLTYVSKMSEDCEQYIGATPFLKRITYFGDLKTPYVQFGSFDDDRNIIGINDRNPLVTLLKNSCFGEYIQKDSYICSMGDIIAHIFFWVNVLIAFVAFAYMIWSCIRRPDMPKLFIAGFHMLMILSFYKTAADYPFVCTMNFRYITPTAITGAVFLGLCMKENRGKDDAPVKAIEIPLGVCACVYCLLSMMVYALLKP